MKFESRLSCFVFLILFGLAHSVASLRCEGASVRIDYYVSPTGKDTADGSIDKPFNSIVGARDRIRADKEAGQSGEWTVHILPGVYPICEPILFEPCDSGTPDNPVRYLGERDSAGRLPLVSGGTEISGWRDEGNGVWSADLPIEDSRPLYFEQLFVGDRRAERAREPNRGFLKVVSGHDDNPMEGKDSPFPKNTFQSVTLEEGALVFMKETPHDELRYAQVVIHHNWDVSRRIILGADVEKSELSMKGKPQLYHNKWTPGSLVEIVNVRSAFDVPGEWFYDGVNGKVYYRPLPGERLENVRFFVPRAGLIRALTLLGSSSKVEGTDEEETQWVENLMFENMAFSFFDTPRREYLMREAELDPAVTGSLDRPGPSQFNAMQAAVFLDSVISGSFARNVSFMNCRISHIGEYAIRLQNVRSCRIERCDLYDLGGGGITISGSGGTTEESSGLANYNVIRNNRIRQGGRFHAESVGILLGNNTHDNEIMHNEIEDFFYTGISVGWFWGYEGGSSLRNRIEFNKIHKIGQGALADMGGVYTLGTLHGTRVCNNVIYDVKSYSYGGWGLYTDEGSEGVLMENNLVYNTTDGSFHQHFGRGNMIRNNILVDSSPHQVVATRVEPHRSFTFENNIIVWSESQAFGHNFEKVNKVVRGNTWFCTTGPAKFGDSGDKTYDQMKAEGFDEGGVCADPLFVNPAKHDYRIRVNSPALKAGFVPFDYSKAGVE